MQVIVTRSQFQVADLLYRYAWSNQQIADYLGVNVRTIESHVYNLLKRADVSSRTELVLWMQTNKLVIKQLRCKK